MRLDRITTRLLLVACFASGVAQPTSAAGDDGTSAIPIRSSSFQIQITRDDRLPGSPAVGLQLNSTPPSKFRDADLEVLRQYPQVKTLTLYCPLTDAAIGQICELKSLTNLELNYCEMTDAGLVKLAALENLKRLRVLSCPHLTGDGFAALTQLTQLRIDGCQQLTHVRVAPLRKLTFLGIRGCAELSAAGLNEVQDLAVLDQLKLIGCRQITNSELSPVKGLSRLKHLSLTFHHEQPDAGLTNLSGLKSLESLSLHGKLIRDAGIADLSQLTQLKSLELDSPEITKDGIVALKGLSSLARLRLACPRVESSRLHVLADLPNLVDLEIDELRDGNLNDAGMSQIKRCTRLKKLVIAGGGMRVTSTGMAELSHLHQLETLVLDGHFEAEALREVTKMPDLKLLQIQLSRSLNIDEFRTALPTTEIVWRKQPKHGAGTWHLESYPRQEPLPRLPAGYQRPYARYVIEPL